MKLQRVKEYIKDTFLEPRPRPEVINEAIQRGDLPGRKLGKFYYVEVGSLSSTGNSLADKVLRDGT